MNYLIFFKKLFKSCGRNFSQLIMLPLAQVLCLLAYCLVFIDIFSITSVNLILFSRYSLSSLMPIALLTLLSFLIFNFKNVLRIKNEINNDNLDNFKNFPLFFVKKIKPDIKYVNEHKVYYISESCWAVSSTCVRDLKFNVKKRKNYIFYYRK